MKNKINLLKTSKEFEDICDILLLDAPSEALPGGNGKKFDWDILKDFKSKKKMDACRRIKHKKYRKRH